MSISDSNGFTLSEDGAKIVQGLVEKAKSLGVTLTLPVDWTQNSSSGLSEIHENVVRGSSLVFSYYVS